MSEIKINAKYKDRLFRWIFSSKKELLDLYNAVRGTNYTDPEALEITTLEDVVYMGFKNDISFLVDDVLNLYEHQSTYSPNMPVRGFLYLADIYRKYLESRDETCTAAVWCSCHFLSIWSFIMEAGKNRIEGY